MSFDEDIHRAVESSFPESDRASAFAALRKYTFGRETTRVCLAILVLAYDDLNEVERLVLAANEDYRDVLYWAEYPEESGAGTKAEMAERYRKLNIDVPDHLCTSD